MTHIILASKSIDRKEIFKRIKIDIISISSNIDEEIFKDKIKDPIILVKELSKAKIFSVKEKIKEEYLDVLIIAADTIVELQGELIGKAKDEEDAFRILRKLAGKTHNIITGISILKFPEEKLIVDYDQSKVEFLDLSDIEIKDYIQKKEWIGKAGAYSIRETASMFIKTIHGSYSNILGLPMQKLYKILNDEFSINLLK
ncbi:MAG: septum formation protein Maf [Candidatus Lokiarchaeota archaeon]|nr:septum formation protein Maf [Candidatus Lokiarchaeota archaeon]